MPHSYGYRARTRSLFSRDFRKHGTVNTSTYTRTFRVGQIVDVKANGAVHKGMPHKFYHGKTGTVWNVTPRAIGVIVNKRVRTRIIPKRLHVRVEHVTHSKCRQEFLNRVKSNEALKKEGKAKGVQVLAKRLPTQPEAGKFVKAGKVCTLAPVPFVWMA